MNKSPIAVSESESVLESVHEFHMSIARVNYYFKNRLQKETVSYSPSRGDSGEIPIFSFSVFRSNRLKFCNIGSKI